MVLSGSVVAIVKLTTDAIAIGCCILRWYIVKKPTGGTQLSHVLFAAAVLCEVAATVLSTMVLLAGDDYIREHGLEKGQLYLRDEFVLKTTFWAHFLYYTAECVLKAAYLAFYADLYSRVRTKRRLAIWIAGAVWAVTYLCAFLVLFTYCSPFEQNWRPDGTNPRCPVLFNVPTFFLLSAVNIVSDIAILIVPLLIISSMTLGRTEKVSLALVFSIGTISIAASVVRCGLVGDRFIKANHTWDTVWNWMLWSHAEIFFGVLAFTLPSFRHVVLRGMRRLGWSTSGKSQGLSSGPGKHQSGRGGGVHVTTTVTVTAKEESLEDFHPTDSQTELTTFEGAKGPKGYGWKIDDSLGRGKRLSS